MKVLRAIIGGIVGLALSWLLGTTVSRNAAYINAAPTEGWVDLVAFVTGFICAIGGLVLGLLVGVLQCSKRWGTILGVIFASILVTYLLSNRWLSDAKLWAALLSLAYIIGGGLIGLLVAVVSARVRPRRSETAHI
jgi:hypothetical protein